MRICNLHYSVYPKAGLSLIKLTTIVKIPSILLFSSTILSLSTTLAATNTHNISFN